MKAVRVKSIWDPKKEYRLGPKDIEGKLTYQGSKIWRNPEIFIEGLPIPVPEEDEVLIEVKACGIRGTDVHLIHTD